MPASEYAVKEEVILVEETPRERRVRQWRVDLTAKREEMEADGYNVEWIEAPEHPMGCYLRASRRNIREAFRDAIVDAYQRRRT